MSNEYIQAKTIAEYWTELQQIYRDANLEFIEISEEKYQSYPQSEREDSDNHLNEARLGNDTQVVDVAFYKYLPNREIAYRVHVVNVEGLEEKHFFKVIPKD